MDLTPITVLLAVLFFLVYQAGMLRGENNRAGLRKKKKNHR